MQVFWRGSILCTNGKTPKHKDSLVSYKYLNGLLHRVE